MRVLFLIFIFAKVFLAFGASIEGDSAFNLLYPFAKNSQPNKLDEKPTPEGDMRQILPDEENKAVPLNSYLQNNDDGTPIVLKHIKQESPFILNPLKPRAILFLQPMYETQEQDNSLSNNGRVTMVASSDESVARSDENVANTVENEANTVQIVPNPYENVEGTINIDNTQEEVVAKPDEKFIQPGEIIEKPDEAEAKPIEYRVNHDKTALKKFLSKLFGSKEAPHTSENDVLKSPAEQIEQVKVPDYDFLLANKPFYDALIIENGLLTGVNKLETIIDNGLSEPHLNAEKPDYALQEEMYKKDFILGIMNIKTEILKFLNWRTAKRLRNLYSGIKLGDYEFKPMPTADFYKEIKHLLKMVRLADLVVDMERINSLEDTKSKISNLIPVNPSNGESPIVERPSIVQNDVERDNNVPKNENIKPIGEINGNDQQNAVKMIEDVDINVSGDENTKKNYKINNKIVEVGDKTDQNAGNDNMMLAASLNDDRDERKDEPVEGIEHPEYSIDEHIFPYWMLWIMDRKFKLQNIHNKNKPSRRWTFLQYGTILDSKYDEDASFNSDNDAAILNSNKMGTILDSNKLKFVPSSNNLSDKQYSKIMDAISNSNETRRLKLKNAILNLNRKHAIWSLKNIGEILDMNKVVDNRRTKIKSGDYRNINNKGNLLIYKKLNSNEGAILNLKRKRAIWSLKRVRHILNSNRIGDRRLKIINENRKSNNIGNFISNNKMAAILNSDEEATPKSKRKRAIWSLKKIGQIMNSNRFGIQTKIIGEDQKSNNKGNFVSYKKMATILKRNQLIKDYLNMDCLRPQMLQQASNSIKPVKRGFSMLTRLKLFSLLSDGYVPPRRIFLPKVPVLYLKNNQVISAETRAMLRPVGAPLRWG